MRDYQIHSILEKMPLPGGVTWHHSGMAPESIVFRGFDSETGNPCTWHESALNAGDVRLAVRFELGDTEADVIEKCQTAIANLQEFAPILAEKG